MDTNQRQAEFYNTKKKNKATRLWSYFRNGLLNKTRKELGIEEEIYQTHKVWCGDISKKKVLDLGCYKGNSLSYYLAVNSKQYIAIDLSENGISHLRKSINNLKNADAYAADFLSPSFEEKEFDLIYAYGVLHHFKDVDELIARLKAKLSPAGMIISHDPLQTSFPIKFIRIIYRPFQSDKDWEWPFSKKTFFKFEKNFKIIEKRGMLGKSKWFFITAFFPNKKEAKINLIKKWHKEDWEKSSYSNTHLFRCMHLTMLMQKKD